MRVEAKTLQEAITKASEELGCSVVDLKIDVIQHPSNGIFGFFKKNAIINALNEKLDKKIEPEKEEKEPKKTKKDKKNNSKHSKVEGAEAKKDVDFNKKENSPKNRAEKKQKRIKQERSDIDLVLTKIEEDIKSLFSKSFFNVDVIEISKFDDKTIYIKLDGEDAALLIGKEGARYKAVSTLLYNFLSLKYGLYVRLEISQFYEKQEKMISNYLKDIFDKIEKNGKAQTRPLDGILIKIALEQLRQKYPEKYIGVRSSKNGKFIIINDKNKKSND